MMLPHGPSAAPRHGATSQSLARRVQALVGCESASGTQQQHCMLAAQALQPAAMVAVKLLLALFWTSAKYRPTSLFQPVVFGMSGDWSAAIFCNPSFAGMPYMPPPKAPAKKVVRPAEAASARQMAELATSPDEPLIRNTMVGRDPVRGAILPQMTFISSYRWSRSRAGCSRQCLEIVYTARLSASQLRIEALTSCACCGIVPLPTLCLLFCAAWRLCILWWGNANPWRHVPSCGY